MADQLDTIGKAIRQIARYPAKRVRSQSGSRHIGTDLQTYGLWARGLGAFTVSCDFWLCPALLWHSHAADTIGSVLGSKRETFRQ